MKLYVPEIGDRLRLTAHWTFDLHNEYRNRTMMEAYNLIHDDKPYKRMTTSDKITVPAGTVLKVDRIYIRQGLQEWSSITFYAEGIGKGKGNFGKPKTARFWAKLSDCNRIEFELESLTSDQKPQLSFRLVREYKKIEYQTTYDSALTPIRMINKFCDIVISKRWDAEPIFRAKITATEINKLEDGTNVKSLLVKYGNESEDSWAGAHKWIVRKWKTTRDDLKYELFDTDYKPLGVEGNSRSIFMKKVKEYYEKV